MGYILPRKDKCPLDFMLAILSGSKLGAKRFQDEMAIAFKPHYDSLLLEDARATD